MRNKSKLIKKEIIDETLNNNVTNGTKHLEPLKSLHFNKEIPFSIIEDSEVDNLPEIHENEADLWYCLEGEVNFICGGEIINNEIVNGIKYLVKKGDWLYIPAKEAHQHNCVKTARLIIIKIPEL